jgi:hypothetical protein
MKRLFHSGIRNRGNGRPQRGKRLRTDEAAFSTRLNDVADEEDFFTQGFATEENESLAFDDSFAFELEDLGSDERQPDDSAAEPSATVAMPAAPEEAVSAESDFDFSDLLEISESDRVASASQDDLLFGEERGIDDEATDLGFDELALDESVDTSILPLVGILTSVSGKLIAPHPALMKPLCSPVPKPQSQRTCYWMTVSQTPCPGNGESRRFRSGGHFIYR